MGDFNPRSPHGERQKHPIRFVNSTDISTHAPRTGSDMARGCLTTTNSTSFQPTLPARGATARNHAPCEAGEFQPTLPARGATSSCTSRKSRRTHFNPRSPHGERQGETRRKPRPARISTHAPRTGSDGAGDSRRSSSPSNFNPRSPHGERHSTSTRRRARKSFQPTLPARGATASGYLPSNMMAIFQPTLPARGATQHPLFL